MSSMYYYDMNYSYRENYRFRSNSCFKSYFNNAINYNNLNNKEYSELFLNNEKKLQEEIYMKKIQNIGN